MASTHLSDLELCSELRRFGFTPGQVNEITRPVYLRKLSKLRDEQQLDMRPGKTRSSSAGGNTTGSRPASHDVMHLSSSRRPDQKSSVLGFSSDESDAEPPQKRKGLNQSGRADRGASFQQQMKLRPVSNPWVAISSQRGTGSTLNSNDSSLDPDGRIWELHTRSSPEAEGRDYAAMRDDSDKDGEREKGSLSLNGSRASHLNTGKLARNYSDSEEEEVGSFGDGDRQDRLGHRRSHLKTVSSSHRVLRGSQTGEAAREVSPSRGLIMVGKRMEEKEEHKGTRKDSGPSGGLQSYNFSRGSISVSCSENDGGESDKNSHVNGEDLAPEQYTSRFSIGLRPRFSSFGGLSQTYRGNQSNHRNPNQPYSQAPLKQKLSAPEDELLQQFKSEEVASSWSFSAHYLSMFLLTAACLFFLLLGLMYLRMCGSGSSDIDGVG